MNWKNLTVENGFVRQEIKLKGVATTSYIPLNQVDSFGVTSLENKRWLYAGCVLLVLTLLMLTMRDSQPALIVGFASLVLIAIYFLTRKISFSITSNQTKFSVYVSLNKQELEAVNAFVEHIKQKIQP